MKYHDATGDGNWISHLPSLLPSPAVHSVSDLTHKNCGMGDGNDGSDGNRGTNNIRVWQFSLARSTEDR